jgi:hypothetical protein
MGCVYSRLFQMEKAVECFWNAYEQSQKQEELITYLLACHCIFTPIEYESRLEELQVEKEVQAAVEKALDAFTAKPEPPVYAPELDQMIDKFTKEYHRSTGS